MIESVDLDQLSEGALTPAMTPVLPPACHRRLSKDFTGSGMKLMDQTQKQELRYAVAAACAVMFAEGFCATMSFPFASFMVEHLRGGTGRLGIMTGIYFTAYPIGSLLTARMWGSQANSLGRRACLLISLCCSTLLTLAIAICPIFEVVVLLRFTQGLMSCSLAMARTCLRERVEQLKGDEVWAFSLMQAAFAASSVVGPALGGILYGWQATPDFLPHILPWAPPQMVASCLYMLSVTFSYAFMVETVDMEIGKRIRAQKSKEVILFTDSSIIDFLIMVAGHSYVFTGWEVGYPLLARSSSLEDWNSARIGITFLVGSVGLLLHTLFTYPTMVKNMGLSAIWSWSWIACVVVISSFPRMIGYLLALGFHPESWAVTFANYLAQLFISVLQGANFTTLQLMLNRIISARDNPEQALPLANAWMVSLQSIARAISPVITGSLAPVPTFYHGRLAFDGLAAVGTVCCLMCGLVLKKTQDCTVFAMEKRLPTSVTTTTTTTTKPQIDVETSADGYHQLKEQENGHSSPSSKGSSPLVGYLLTIGLASLSAVITLVTGLASKAVALPHYTENFVRCFSGSITLAIMCKVSGTKMKQDPATMKSSAWLACADWFFLWGYVEAMQYFTPTQYSATSISMTPILSVPLGLLFLSESVSITKLIGMLRNVMVVILVIDPFGFFSEPGSSGSQPASPGTPNASSTSLISGFVWGLVACLGSVFMRIVQRRLTHVPSIVTSFWCFAINAVLWFPPGSIPPEIRVPFLWPTTPQDHLGLGAVPASIWLATMFSGCLGALMISGQAITLKYIDVGTFSTLIAPLNLVFSFAITAFTTSTPQPPRAMYGVLLAILGIVAETCVNKFANSKVSNSSG